MVPRCPFWFRVLHANVVRTGRVNLAPADESWLYVPSRNVVALFMTEYLLMRMAPTVAPTEDDAYYEGMEQIARGGRSAIRLGWMTALIAQWGSAGGLPEWG